MFFFFFFSFFQKKSLCNFLGKKMESTLPKYGFNFTIKLLLINPSIGHSISYFLPLVLNGKKNVDLLISFCAAIYQ